MTKNRGTFARTVAAVVISTASLNGTITTCEAFSSIPQTRSTKRHTTLTTLYQSAGSKEVEEATNAAINSRRNAAVSMVSAFAAGAATLFAGSEPALAEAEDYKFLQSYPDYTASPSGGWSYKDGGQGTGPTPNEGDRVVYDWTGYTIGYFGRPFEAKGGPQGGAFDKELDFSRSILGKHTIVPALEEAFQSMKVGGVRQVIVPFGKYGYPQATDPKHEQVGPKPTTFSGQRALNFVLDNPRVDRTLLFNIKLIRIDRPDGKGGFLRGDKAGPR
jgi:FKBP-type peptidyl-prolyl cis-trans isomerase